MKHIGIAGVGNVGSILAVEMARTSDGLRVDLAARNSAHARAAILDAASVYPEAASRFVPTENLEGSYDVVVVTAGLMPGDMGIDDLLKANLKLVHDYTKNVTCKTLVVIGTPVDRLTEVLTHDRNFKDTKVIGYGGELDRSRIEYALYKRNITFEDVYAIGEHGPRTIPVYESEQEFSAVREDATTALGRIMKSVDKARNIASGYQLARLVNALCGETQSVQCISICDSDHSNLAITWPYLISSNKTKKLDILLGDKAKKALDQLIVARKEEALNQ